MNIRHPELGKAAVDRAQVLDGCLRCVRIPELIALKLYAGGRKSEDDIHELLDANPACDLAEIDAVCAELGLHEDWAQIVPERE